MQELDWNQVVTHLYQLGIAFVLALPVAWNREQRARGAGLRTFPLVSVAACGYMLVGTRALMRKPGSCTESSREWALSVVVRF